MTRRRRLIVAGSAAAALALSVVLIVTLSGTAAPAKPAAAQAVAPWQPTPPKQKPRPKPPPLTDPFTGVRVKKLNTTLIVKIDNIVDARPQTGLQSADIVYVLPVEGGLTRFFAVFSSHFPRVIGPVRSSREDDLELLRQFGRPGFSYSGATPHLLPFIHRARIVDLYAGIAGGYFRDPNRFAPHNLYAYSSVLLSEAKKASKARDIGLRFGPPPAGGHPIKSYSVSYPAASYTFRWSAKQKRWLVWMDGAPAMATEGGQMGGRTVVIQYTIIKTSRFKEYGSRPPYAVSTGSGRAVVLIDGKGYNVHWSRPNANGGTIYTLPSGKRMMFSPGQVWVVLAGRWP